MLCSVEVPPEVAKEWARWERQRRSVTVYSWEWNAMVYGSMRAAGFVLKVSE